MTAIYIVMMMIVVMSLGAYIGFARNDGRDERGRTILAKSSQIAFIFILAGFVFQILYFQFAEPNPDHIKAAISVWMALIFGSNAVSIVILQRKM
ncbi:hypothetical protein PAEN110709_17980 [Paenibacillus endophyticus]